MSSRVLNYSLPDSIRVRTPGTVYTLDPLEIEYGISRESQLRGMVASQLIGSSYETDYWARMITADALNKLDHNRQLVYLICLSDQIQKAKPIVVLSERDRGNPGVRSLRMAFIEGEI